MKILSLTLENFRSIKNMTVNFDGRDAYVSSNAIGDPECNYANNYPENITIQMSDGEEVDYVRDGR